MRSVDSTLSDAKAAARFDRLPTAAQMALAREIVQTRAAEISRAYENLVMVTAGFRSQRDQQGKSLLHPQPCVILGVKSKWAGDGGSGEPEAQRLPKRLLTYSTHRGIRALYAVQTDVQPVRWFRGAVARAATAVRVQGDKAQFTGNGTVACVARVRTSHGTISFGLSAMHVFSPVPQLDLATPAGGAPFHVVGSGSSAGNSAAWVGRLSEASLSFDAQLADISDEAWLNSAFAGLSLSSSHPYVASNEEFDGLAARRRFLILAPDNHVDHLAALRDPMVAQFRSYAYEDVPVGYKVRANGISTMMPIRHSELLMLEVTGDSPAPAQGDSGSAVITWRSDGSMTLAGMFIASMDGDDRRTAFVLPAWQLFKLDNWSALPPSTTRITPAFAMP